MILLDNYQDRFGFYKVGDFKTYSKIEAIEQHNRTNIHPQWFFNDEIFSSYDWKIEPKESLDELYRKRAQQIREKYDYLVLWYSSGADSENILNTFIDNNIHLDEAVSFIDYEATKDANSYNNNEITLVAKEQMKLYQEKNKHLKYRYVDYTSTVLKLFNSAEFKFDYMYHSNSSWTPNGIARCFLYKTVNEWQNMRAAGKKVGFIWGIEKPRLYIENGKYCFKFLDINDAQVGPKNQTLNEDGLFNEFFYWSGELPEIPIKQAHVIMKFLKTCPIPHPWFENKMNALPCAVRNGRRFYITPEGLNYLIYSKYVFREANKSKAKQFYSPRDEWFYNLNGSDGQYNWNIGLKKMWKIIPDYWKNDPRDLFKGIKSLVSPSYFLE